MHPDLPRTGVKVPRWREGIASDSLLHWSRRVLQLSCKTVNVMIRSSLFAASES